MCVSTVEVGPSLRINSIIIPGDAKMKIRSNNPMQPAQLAEAPRCLARTRSGGECQSPAVKGKRRCRMHGGTNPGAPQGNRNARKHGCYSAEAKNAAQYLKAMARFVRESEVA